MTMLAAVGVWLALATAPADGSAPAGVARPAPALGKLAPATSKEMADAIIAVNKALGLESWPAHGVKPCIDRGGQGILAKDVTPQDARRCAMAALGKGFPALGQSYVLAVLMGSIGPTTVIALGTGDAAGWGAYSCDPARACKPMKIDPGNKWGQRLDERRAKSCAEPATLWLPAADARACGAAK